jgi:hypothetical protein
MCKNIENNPTNNTTKRPNSPLLKRSGSYFIPIKLNEFRYQIILPYYASSNDLISLFTLYYTFKIVKQIVQYTNKDKRDS